jgi:hypothetical protein
MLAKGLGAAAAAVGAGAVLDFGSAGTAHAGVKSGVFASSTAGTPAVKATGTNGADAVDAGSDAGTGVEAASASGTGLATTSSSSSGLAGHSSGGDVKIDNNLDVAGAVSAGALSSAAGSLASAQRRHDIRPHGNRDELAD